MPGKTRKQRVTAAIAKHNPSKLYKRNRGMLSMSQEELGRMARKPKRKKRKRRKG